MGYASQTKDLSQNSTLACVKKIMVQDSTKERLCIDGVWNDTLSYFIGIVTKIRLLQLFLGYYLF